MRHSHLIPVFAVVLGASTPARSAAPPQSTAFYTDCRSVGGDTKTGYQFIVTCAGRSLSPDRRYAIVQRAYKDNQPTIEFQDARGRTLAKLASLSDDMPFQVFWAANSRWFFVNHHIGSFMDELKVFEVVRGRIIERTALTRSAARIAAGRYPCLHQNMVVPNGTRWSRDGTHIVMFTTSRTDACTIFRRRPGTWQPLWMIGDVRTGRVDPASIRVDRSRDGLREPRGGIYARS